MADRYYRMLSSLHIGCEAPRAYFVPFADEKSASTDRENSSLLTLLNGQWDFSFFENVEELELEDENFTSTVICKDKIDVLCCPCDPYFFTSTLLIVNEKSSL